MAPDFMLLQSVLVALLVTLCSVYAVWTLMPAGLRRAFATALLALPLKFPAGFAARLQQAAQAVSGCGACGSCDRAAPKRNAAAAQTITFHPRLRR